VNGLKNIEVTLQWVDRDEKVGYLSRTEQGIYFKYLDDYLENGHSLSPIKLRWDNSAQKCDLGFLEGLHGVFYDSLPDGWGRLLTDRHFVKNKIAFEDIGALDRLSLVGENGLGVLQYRPMDESNKTEFLDWQLEQMYNESISIYKDESNQGLDQILLIGGSSGGARPKVHVYYNRDEHHFITDVKKVDESYEPWIIKFESSSDIEYAAQVEYAYSLMAKDCGIEMSETQLFEVSKDKKAFGTRRFDRLHHDRFHMLSVAGLLHDNFRMCAIDYGHIMNAGYQLCKSSKSYLDVLRVASFNLYANNQDDHSKNFAFLMDKKGQWRFSPAYDLTYINTHHGHHSIGYDGQSKNPTSKNLRDLAEMFDIKNEGLEMINRVKEIVSNWTYYADIAGVSKSIINNIDSHLQKLLKI
jgi:serine/threonine-protein kinase HipA